jgi:hypothetical protein
MKIANCKLGENISGTGRELKRVLLCIWAVSICFFSTGAAETSSSSEKASNSLDPDFKHFIAEKRALAKRLGEKHGDAVPQTVWDFFDVAEKGDWLSTSNLFYKIEGGSGRHGGSRWIPISLWGAIHDTFGAYEQFHSWNAQMLHRFGDAIIEKIPAGSIYFGGTDSGRFVVSALCASHTEGRPFFTVTQNALADGSYLDYLRDIYGDKIYVPTAEDSQRVFKEYLADAQTRREKNQLKENEHVEIVNDRVQVSGLVAVMAINELLCKYIIEKNPSREIYLEESYPMESLYAQSVPHGLIFKLKHEKMKDLPWQIVGADHRFWTDECQSLIGDAVKDRGSVNELCAWTERVLMHPNGGGFEGRRAYLEDKQAPQYWSQCRSAIAGYYEWWSKNSEKSRHSSLNDEADFAYRQSVALSPYNPTVAWRYADFLIHNQRTNDAKVLVETTLKIEPEKRMDIDSDQLKGALKKLRDEAKRLSTGEGKKE